MINTRLFRKHYVATTSIIIGFIVAGFFLSNAINEMILERELRARSSENLSSSFLGEHSPDLLFAKILEEFRSAVGGDRLRAVKKLRELSGDSPFLLFNLIDENGNNLSRDGDTPARWPLKWAEISKPTAAFDAVRETDPRGGTLVRLPGVPIQYLFINRVEKHDDPGMPPMMTGGPPPLHPPFGGPPNRFPGPPPFVFLTTTGALILSLLLGIGVSLLLLFRSMRQKMTLADQVIAELRKGNLKARFPIQKMDEFGEAMQRFNKMADEIEYLVEKLRSVERSRMRLLQDLAHDLRTPVASMKNLLATVAKKCDPAQQAVAIELLSLAQREVDYFERLVEDLLVLAQVGEPAYKEGLQSVSLPEILEDEAQNVFAPGKVGEKEVEFLYRLPREQAQVSGDAHLLRRMFRNALENAYSFARKKVTVTLFSDDKGMIHVNFEDDGPGFSEVALKAFGERRSSRVLEKSQGNRLSVGLGSVIMKTVAETHRGRVNATNRQDPSGRRVGAAVSVELPQEAPPPAANET